MSLSGVCGLSINFISRCFALLSQPIGMVAAFAGLAACFLQRDRICALFQAIFNRTAAADQSTQLVGDVNGFRLVTDRVEKPGDPSKHYVSVSLAQAAAKGAKKVDGAAHLILVIDVSGSMEGSRITTVRESIKALDVDENKNLLLTVITYDDKATTWIRKAKVSAVAAEIDRYTKIKGCTCFGPALDALDGEVRSSGKDGVPTSAIFLTDGEATSKDELRERGLAKSHKLWREKNVTPIMVGLEQDDVQTLNQIKGDLPGAQYFHISKEQKANELTFAQIVNEVTKKTKEVLIQNASLQISPSCTGLGGVNFDSRVGPVSPADHYLVEVPSSEKNVQITLTGTTLADKRVVTLQSSLNRVAKNDSIVWLALMTEAQNIQVEAVRSYAQDKSKAQVHIKNMQTILGHIQSFKGAGKPDELTGIEGRLKGYIEKMEKRQDLVNDDLFAAYSTVGAYSRAGSSSSSSSGSGAIVMAPQGFSRAQQTNIPPINQAFYDAEMLSIPKANVDETGIVVNARDLFIKGDNGQVKVTLPMGYHRLGGIESGEIFSFSLTEETEHQQITGRFGPNTNIAKFEEENKVKFLLPCERDAKVTLDDAGKADWGISPDADAYFQWIGPSAATYRPEPGSPYYYDQTTPAQEVGRKKQLLLDKMRDSLQGKSGGVKLSSLEYFALTIGFFAYHQDDYYCLERNGTKVNYRWDRQEGIFRQWDAKNEQFVDGGKFFKANSFQANQLMRKLTQVRVLDPTSTFGGQFFPFDDLVQIPHLDQKKRNRLKITYSLQDEMQRWHEGKDDPLFGVTVEGLKQLGITHARWLNPAEKHYGKLIGDIKRTLHHTAKTEEEKKKYAEEAKWGLYGVYVYYCEKNPQNCYVIAMVDRDQAIASLKGKYQITVEGAGKMQQIELEQSTCVVCEKNAPVMKLSCGETPYCSDCYEDVFTPADLLKIKCTNPAVACDGVTTITKDQRASALVAQGDDKYIACESCDYPNEVPLHTCASCHQSVDIAKTEAKPLAATKMAEILKGIPQFTFHLAKIDMAYDMDDFIVKFLKDKTYCSDQHPVPNEVKVALNLPNNVATWAFVSPVIGLDLATSLGVSDLFRLGLSHLADKGKQKEHEIIEALYKTGGNVFFDREGNVVTAYAYFIEPNADRVPLSFKTSAQPSVEEINRFKTAYNQGKKTHITAKSLHELAKWFSFNGKGFTYMLPGKNLDTSGFFVANLSGDMQPGAQ